MTFPTTSVIDNFNRADANPDSKWSGIFGTGSAAVVSNKLTSGAAGTNQMYYNQAGYGLDQEAYVTISTLPANGEGVRLFVRVSSPGSFPGPTAYFAIWTYNSGGTDTWTLYKIDAAGTATQLTSASQDVSATDTIGISVVGTTITGYLNGTSVLSTTDSSLASGVFIGLSMQNTTVRVDDFGGGTVGGAPVLPTRTFPTTSVVDSFTRSDTTTDWNWDDLFSNGSAVNVSSNKLRNGGAGLNQVLFNRNGYQNDQEAFVTISTLPATGQYQMVFARVNNPGPYPGPSGYWVRWTYNSGGIDEWLLQKVTADGTVTTIAAAAEDVTTGDKIGISVIGTEVTGWHYSGSAWAAVLSVTDSSNATGQFVGLGVNNTTVRLDDFGGGTTLSAGGDTASPWTPANVSLFNPAGPGGNNGEEPSVLIEGGKFKMWWQSGNMNYSECSTANDPTDPTKWTTTMNVLGGGNGGYAGDVGGIFVWRDGATLRLHFYSVAGSNDNYTSTSTDGTTWTTPVVAISHTQKVWAIGFGNTYAWKDGSTYKAILDIKTSVTPTWAIAYATSTDGVTYTLQGSGPITSLANTSGSGAYGGAFLLNNALPIGGLYYLYYLGCPNRTEYPSNIYLATTPDTPSNTATWTVRRNVQLAHDAGVALNPVQVSDPCIVENNGTTYMFYDGTNGDFNPRSVLAATYAGTINQLLGISSAGIGGSGLVSLFDLWK